jgi:hypothetical protein
VEPLRCISPDKADCRGITRRWHRFQSSSCGMQTQKLSRAQLSCAEIFDLCPSYADTALSSLT